MKKHIEKNLEQLIFASRWLLAPVYIALCFSLITITVKVIQEIVHEAPLILSMEVSEVLVFVLHVLDLALVGNLVLMIIFAGYENFVSKIESARQSEDKPSWMGKVDFSGMKLKLVASIVAISGINLLGAFLEPKSYSENELMWMVILHVVFVISGVLLAFMDYIASKTQPH